MFQFYHFDLKLFLEFVADLLFGLLDIVLIRVLDHCDRILQLSRNSDTKIDLKIRKKISPKSHNFFYTKMYKNGANKPSLFFKLFFDTLKLRFDLIRFIERMDRVVRRGTRGPLILLNAFLNITLRIASHMHFGGLSQFGQSQIINGMRQLRVIIVLVRFVDAIGQSQTVNAFGFAFVQWRFCVIYSSDVCIKQFDAVLQCNVIGRAMVGDEIILRTVVFGFGVDIEFVIVGVTVGLDCVFEYILLRFNVCQCAFLALERE